MRKLGLIFLSALAILASTSTFAFLSLPTGFYVDPNIGYSDASAKNSNTESGVGFNVNAGYKFNPYFAMEVGFSQYQNTYVRLPSATQVGPGTANPNCAKTDMILPAGKKAATISLFNFDVALKGIVPFGVTGFELFGKLGAQRTTSDLTIDNNKAACVLGISQNGNHTNNASGLYIGAGAQYNFTPSLAGTVQWSRAFGNNGNLKLDLYSAGVTYIFGWL